MFCQKMYSQEYDLLQQIDSDELILGRCGTPEIGIVVSGAYIEERLIFGRCNTCLVLGNMQGLGVAFTCTFCSNLHTPSAPSAIDLKKCSDKRSVGKRRRQTLSTS